ncbi:KilA-N domain-containing protein [Halodesulfovibrio sp.]|jgi:hypothetical protein|uniref:KilA-N domain-containing protein n=1 Tax=Halodesulfovibrio sp. TaxID=1912772 RepID=UPI0025D68A04|nr:KilA-N domain-containing protein [Halodesulfovibrio sp.]MCT4627241.1 KilA-N domain-containing protein [Halodesulfovibrio sp.]
MKRQVELTFNGITALIESDDEGFFNLKDIWKSFKLPDSKRPQNWRDEMRRVLENDAKLRHYGKGRNSKLLADEDAVYAYAGWVQPEFAF